MTDLFKKLNLLLRSSLPDVTSPAGEARPAPPRLGKDVDREIAALNDRVRDAHAYEAQLKARADKLEAEIFALDEAADSAVADGQEDTARYHIEHLKRAQARLDMTYADLREHQRVTAELELRVNALENAVAEARAAQAPAEPDTRPSLADVLRGARERFEAATTGEPETPPEEKEPPAPKKPASSGDDLDQRIQRLSK